MTNLSAPLNGSDVVMLVTDIKSFRKQKSTEETEKDTEAHGCSVIRTLPLSKGDHSLVMTLE